MAEIATPIFGYKSHIGIDHRRGFIRTIGLERAKQRSASPTPFSFNRFLYCENRNGHDMMAHPEGRAIANE